MPYSSPIYHTLHLCNIPKWSLQCINPDHTPHLYNVCTILILLSVFRAQELCESRGGRPGPTVSVDVKQHFNNSKTVRAQELCESGGGRPGLPVPNKPTVSADVKQHSTKAQCHGHKPPADRDGGWVVALSRPKTDRKCVMSL